MIYTIYKTEYYAAQIDADSEEEVEGVLKHAPEVLGWQKIETEVELGEFPNEDAEESY